MTKSLRSLCILRQWRRFLKNSTGTRRSSSQDCSTCVICSRSSSQTCRPNKQPRSSSTLRSEAVEKVSQELYRNKAKFESRLFYLCDLFPEFITNVQTKQAAQIILNSQIGGSGEGFSRTLQEQGEVRVKTVLPV